MHARLRFVASMLLAACSGMACGARDEPKPQQPAYYPPAGAPPGYASPGYGVPGYGGAPYGPPQYAPPPGTAPMPTAGSPPALGFPCASDNELQCPFGRCINGRCGGCASGNDCKAGAGCVPTPFGASCFPGMGGGASLPAPSMPPPKVPMPAPAPAPTPVPNGSDPFAASRDRCVQLTNMYRARVGAAPVAREPASEPCGDRQSAADARTSSAHGNFGSCGEFAQNTCPNYPGATVDEVMTRCFQQMFDEGPGGGHYDNMTNRKYTRVHCGFTQVSGGRFWINQNFR